MENVPGFYNRVNQTISTTQVVNCKDYGKTKELTRSSVTAARVCTKEIELLKHQVTELRNEIDHTRDNFNRDSRRQMCTIIKWRANSLLLSNNTVDAQKRIIDQNVALKYAATALRNQQINMNKLLCESHSIQLENAALKMELKELESEMVFKQLVEEGLREDTEDLGEALAEKTEEQLNAHLALINDLSQVRHVLARCQASNICRELVLEIIVDSLDSARRSKN